MCTDPVIPGLVGSGFVPLSQQGEDFRGLKNGSGHMAGRAWETCKCFLLASERAETDCTTSDFLHNHTILSDTRLKASWDTATDMEWKELWRPELLQDHCHYGWEQWWTEWETRVGWGEPPVYVWIEWSVHSCDSREQGAAGGPN